MLIPSSEAKKFVDDVIAIYDDGLKQINNTFKEFDLIDVEIRYWACVKYTNDFLRDLKKRFREMEDRLENTNARSV